MLLLNLSIDGCISMNVNKCQFDNFKNNIFQKGLML